MYLLFLQSLLYKKVHEAQFRSHLANEMMMYHLKVKSYIYTLPVNEPKITDTVSLLHLIQYVYATGFI